MGGGLVSRSIKGKGKGHRGAGEEGEWKFGMEETITFLKLETQAIFFHRKSHHPSILLTYE